MMFSKKFQLIALPSFLAIGLAGCGGGSSGSDGSAQTGGVTLPPTQSPAPSPTPTPAPTPPKPNVPLALQKDPIGTFANPWAVSFAPGTSFAFISERAGTMKFVDIRNGQIGNVSGLPDVDFRGQGGLGDIAFLPSEAASSLGRRTIYLSWAEAGSGDTRGAAVGRGTLICDPTTTCQIEALTVIWRQEPKVDGDGHYSHKIAISPDGKYLFVSSGDRQKQTPAQDNGNTLGTIVRLNLDGSPATGNPFANRGGPANQIWSFGHRNILGLQFAPNGSLWAAEHGPRGGDEFNRIESGANYGWPIVSEGEHYDGRPIPSHSSRSDLKAPTLSWTPAIAPGDFIFYTGTAFNPWRGDALIAGLKSKAIIQVKLSGDTATETKRFAFDYRLRDIAQGPDGHVYVIEDGDNGRLLKLTPG